MGLFSVTKKPEEKRPAGVQRISSFPEFPPIEEEHGTSEFPAYEPTIGDIKKEITKSETNSPFEIPTREKKPEPRMFAATQMQQPSFMPSRTAESRSSPASSEDHMLFIKIDKYKDAMHDIQHLKTKISEAEKILSSLEELKAEEDSKLSKWNSEIQGLKEKLMSLDKTLFE